jgi:hypothetical protein
LLDYRTRGYFVFFILLFMSRGKYKVPWAYVMCVRCNVCFWEG